MPPSVSGEWIISRVPATSNCCHNSRDRVLVTAVFYFGGFRLVSHTITALEVQKNNTERVSVFLDGEFAFGLPLLDAANLRQGQVLSDDEITVLREIDAVARALDHAVRLLARRPYSTVEIRRNLTSKQIASPVIDEVIARLERLGYVDDQAFAEYWVENRERFRPRGLRALRYELRQKGIPDRIIDAVVQDVDADDSAYHAARKRISRYRHKSRQEFRDKLGAFLVRRGFDYDVVRDVIDTLTNELENEEPEFFAPDYTSEE